MEGGFSAGDGDTFNEPLAFFKEKEDLFFGKILASGHGNETGIVAVGAVKIAALGKEKGGNSAGKIDEGVFLKSTEAHGIP